MMKIMWKYVVGFFGVALAGLASAQVVDGSIVFQAAQSAVQPLAVPTMGVLAGVVLGALLLVLARRAIHENRQTLASFSLLAAALAGTLMLGSLGVLHANGVKNVDVTDQNLGQSLSFECPTSTNVGTIETTFTNTTSGSIEVVSIDPANCIISTLVVSACLPSAAPNGPTKLAPGESCLVAAQLPRG